MFKPVAMQKIRLVALNDVSKLLVATLHELGAIEVSKMPESELTTNTPFSDFDNISSRIVLLRSIKNILEKHSTKKSDKKISESKLENLETELKSLSQESSKINSEISKLNEDLELTKTLSMFDVDFSKLNTTLSTHTFGFISRENYVKCSAILDKNPNLKYSAKFTKTKAYLLVLYKNGFQIDEILSKFNFVKVNLPEELTTPSNYFNHLHSKKQKLEEKLETINSRLLFLAENFYAPISELLERYNIASQRSKIASKFGFSNDMVVIQGWIQKSKCDELNSIIQKEYPKKVALFKVQTKEHPPIKLDNPTSMGSIEFFVRMFSLPNHHELDPTFVFFFTAPLFYGMIMGDVIYGLFSLVVAFLLLKKLNPKGVLNFTIKLWMFSSIPAILFGLFFDEWMALHHIDFFNYLAGYGLPLGLEEPLYHGFSRIHNTTALIGISAIVGVAHLAIGFLLGAINEWNHNRKHAIGKLAWIGIDIAGTIFVMSMLFGMFDETIGLISGVILAISAIIVVWSEGFIGVLEIPGLAGNILSYTRIAAVGIVGVILAELINEFFLPDPSSLLMVLVMIPVLLILHGLNVLIVMLEALIHGGRLNIVEFQSKFMHGGGREFRPFMVKNKM